jgi:FkbM family methyltransferase
MAETVVSFAQNYEDVLLWRALGGKRDGFYVDIGAGHLFADNVTHWFHKQGWRGINIEANPIFAAEYDRIRPLDITLNIGVAEVAGAMRFYRVLQNEVGHGWGLSSFSPSTPDLARKLGFECEEIVVRTSPLRKIIADHAKSQKIDFLKVDVEGFESSVLASADWRLFRPTIVCVEAVEPNSASPSQGAWEPILLEAGYEFAIFDGVNAYYVCDGSASVMSQLNAGVNCNDKYRRATNEDH